MCVLGSNLGQACVASVLNCGPISLAPGKKFTFYHRHLDLNFVDLLPNSAGIKVLDSSKDYETPILYCILMSRCSSLEII